MGGRGMLVGGGRGRGMGGRGMLVGKRERQGNGGGLGLCRDADG